MVLATLLIVVVLANVALSVIASQSRLTHHQVSRIRAFYAAQAGMVLAIENLRTGTWVDNQNYCINCPAAMVPPGNRIIDPEIPYAVRINILPKNADPPGSAGPIANTSPIQILVDYSYNP